MGKLASTEGLWDVDLKELKVQSVDHLQRKWKR
jgi:hypothetical protein